MKLTSKLFVGLGLVGLLFAASVPSFAHKRDFAWTYEWFTPVKGEKELELWGTDVPKESEFQGQVEFEYGISDRWLVAPYAMYEKQPGESLKLNGWKLEQRYRFGDFREKRLLPAAYFEVAKEDGEPYELEAKGIFSYLNGGTNFAFNVITEKKLTANSTFELAYATGISKKIGRQTRGAIEAHGNFHDSQHAIGPGIAVDLSPSQRININAGFGLNNNTDNLTLRVVYEYEWLPR